MGRKATNQISLRGLLGAAWWYSWFSVSGMQRTLGFGCMQTRGWKDDAERRDQDLANCAAAVDSGEPNPGTGWFSEVSLTARNGFGNDDEKGCHRHERNVCYSVSCDVVFGEVEEASSR